MATPEALSWFEGVCVRLCSAVLGAATGLKKSCSVPVLPVFCFPLPFVLPFCFPLAFPF